MSDNPKLPQAADFPPGTRFVIKEIDVPLVCVPDGGWFNWYGGPPPRPYDDSRLRVDNNWSAESFGEWLGVVEASLRDRWIGRILAGAHIDTHTKTWWELNSILVSLYFQEKNSRGDGASAAHLDFRPAECTFLAAISAAESRQAGTNLGAALGISDVDASALLASVRIAALELAKQEMPSALPSRTGGQKNLPFAGNDA